MRNYRHVGLDVHSKTISIAVASADGLRSLGKIANDVVTLKKTLSKIGIPEELRVVYEAGPTGYGLFRELRKWGADCAVIAPTLVPRLEGDRVKTDRRDAKKLAQFSFGGLLTEVSVPDQMDEAVRDLVRAREAAKKDQTRARHQLSKLLLRRGVKLPMKKWSKGFVPWLRTLRFEERAAQYALEEGIAEVEHQTTRVERLEGQLREVVVDLSEIRQEVVKALQGFKGIKFITAITIVAEVGDMMRFAHPTQLMSYSGNVPSEYSSGEQVRRGAITKRGNAHLRRVVGEAAWSYSRGIATPGPTILKRRNGLSAGVVQILEKADHRLRSRYRALVAKGKHRNKVTTAVARELLGFVWDVAVHVQMEQAKKAA